MRRSEAIRAAIPVRTPDATRTPRRPRGRARQLTGEQLGALIEAYEAGDSTYVLAQRFAITRETVAAHLRRAGVRTRALERVELTAEERAEAQRLWGALRMGQRDHPFVATCCGLAGSDLNRSDPEQAAAYDEAEHRHFSS